MSITSPEGFKLLEYGSFLYGELLCPHCGGSNLHHNEVHSWVRDTEDADKGLHVGVSVGDQNVHVCRDMGYNPSSRRDGVRIIFWCETCDEFPELYLYQHKGTTFVHWGTREDTGK